MNRKYILVSFVILASLVGVVIGYKISKELGAKKEITLMQQKLSINGLEYLTNNHIDGNKQTIISLFHPSCEFCQAEAEQFRDVGTGLKRFELIWVSYDEKDSIQKFSKTYGLDTLPSMHFAYMDIEVMLERYGNVKFPTFLVYDEEGLLVKKRVGMTQPQEILEAYNEEN